MARRIEHQCSYDTDSAAVFATVIDERYLRARLAEIGGPRARLEEFTVTENGMSSHARHGVDAADLPSAVRALVGGDLTIDRRESWQRNGHAYTGSIEVSIPNMPGDLSAQTQLSDLAAGSELRTDGSIRIPIPLVGAKIEESVSAHLIALLDTEHEFTVRWLREQQR
ncbi:MAG: DUF2505 domain-containing protein [Sciscionella sp.]